MISDSGIFYHEHPKELWTPKIIPARALPMAVRFKTWICDAQGRKLRVGNEGWNTITDWGMDSLATINQAILASNLHLSTSLGTGKRVLSGGTTLSITSTADPTNVSVVASANFFLSGDVGNTLYIDGLGQELKIVAFTDAQHVTCATRPSVWLPGITPSTGPFSTAGVHFTSIATLAADFQAISTFDTSASQNNAEISDYTNTRFIHQRIWLSGAFGTGQTIQQVGWSNNTTIGGNCFGKINLTTPDTVNAGQKYRLQLQLFCGYTPINLSSVPINWGATIGSYSLNIRTEELRFDWSGSSTNDSSQGSNSGCFLIPTGTPSGTSTNWFTSAFSLVGPYFWGDPSYNSGPHYPPAGSSGTNDLSYAAYSTGTFMKSATWKISDTLSISGATGFVMGGTGNQCLSFAPAGGTITKPSGYYASLIFPIYWTRQLLN
ncbi:MAG: hypothetical protein KGJ60_13880 [Verrucomicrobiota bacterium]|nr:hypothetical protein [Verrucomicrobiota bacterium]